MPSYEPKLHLTTQSPLPGLSRFAWLLRGPPARRGLRGRLLAWVLLAVVFYASCKVFSFSPVEHSRSVIHLAYELPRSAASWTRPPMRTLSLTDVEPDIPKRIDFIHPRHEYHADGLLIANPNGSHPIHELIENAQKKWDRMLKRQSKTLRDAVKEYKRRYGRSPPKGFGLWWNYVQEHNILLPDEYDQIHRDLAHFWAISPSQLRAAEAAHELHEETYTIGKSEGSPISVVATAFLEHSNHALHLETARQMIEVLKPVEDMIPPFRAIFSPHDSPNLLSSWQMKAEAQQAISQGRYLDVNDLKSVESVGWMSACSPTSPARTTPMDHDSTPSPPDLSISGRSRTFVHNHLQAMDPCLHPSIIRSHGEFLPHPVGPGLPEVVMAPQFSYSSSPLHGDLRPATPFGWIEDLGSDDLTWDEKSDTPEGSQGKLLWRGSNTGVYCGDWHPWAQSQRQRLVKMAETDAGSLSVMQEARWGPTPSRYWRGRDLHQTPDHSAWEVVEVDRASFGEEMLDVHFAGKPIQCEPNVCAEMEEMFDWQSGMSWKQASRFKYVMDVDGNGWSSRFKRLITSNALILKSTVYPEWFSERIVPWVHFVPVQNDYSDLYDIMAFFRGGLNGQGGHDDLARKIAGAGKVWSQTMWRREDLTAYMFRMMLEYARLMSDDREAMSFQA